MEFMRRLWACIVVILLFTHIAPSNDAKFSLNDILYVGGSGEGNYTTIQAALNDAKDGDTIFVYSGTYHENLVVSKSITLRGENKETTIIDGERKGDVIYITANGVKISGFTITHSGWEDNEAGIRIINADYCEIFDCVISENNRGIYGMRAHHNIIRDSIISDAERLSNIAFYYSSYNHLRNLTVLRANWTGIFFTNGQHNKIENCVVIDCGYYGIGIDYSQYCTVSNCTMENAANGIKLYKTHNSIFYNNTITTSKGSGVTLYYSTGNNFSWCEMEENTYNGIYMKSCGDNKIEKCILQNNNICGIYIELAAGSNTVRMCNIKGNHQLGVYLKQCSAITLVNYNNIYNNGWGLWANASSCDARHNYWGTIFGPLTFGLLGDGIGWDGGAKVSFFPWQLFEIEW